MERGKRTGRESVGRKKRGEDREGECRKKRERRGQGGRVDGERAEGGSKQGERERRGMEERRRGGEREGEGRRMEDRTPRWKGRRERKGKEDVKKEGESGWKKRKGERDRVDNIIVRLVTAQEMAAVWMALPEDWEIQTSCNIITLSAFPGVETLQVHICKECVRVSTFPEKRGVLNNTAVSNVSIKFTQTVPIYM